MNNEMQTQEASAVNYGSTALTIISWIFGLIFFAIGVVNTGWGGDTGFGIFIILLSLVYFLPLKNLVRRTIGMSETGVRIAKILLGFFIIWAAMGVGELFDKIELMMMDI